jgi:hypothetical protein
MTPTLYTVADNDGRSIFVFGSNLAGVHGAGAALEAKRHWGAKYGVGVGRTGQAYAVPTKDLTIQTLPLVEIRMYVHDFIEYAAANPDLRFLVTKIGCGLAGHSEDAIKPMFSDARELANVVLPEGWRQGNQRTHSQTPLERIPNAPHTTIQRPNAARIQPSH